MVARLRSRRSWVFCVVGVIGLGLLSRAVRTGQPLFDKYLGDALYAVMVYGISRLFIGTAPSTVWATVVMTAIEFFQLTMIPARMLGSDSLLTRLCARLLGTEFSTLDLVAYGVGIASIHLVDSLPRWVEEEPTAGGRRRWGNGRETG